MSTFPLVTLSGLNRNRRLGDSLDFALPKYDVRDEYILTELNMNERISDTEYVSQNIHHEMSRVGGKKRCIQGLGMVVI